MNSQEVRELAYRVMHASPQDLHASREQVSDAIRALVEERDNLRKMASVEIQAAQGMARAAALALAERVKIYGIENTITARHEIVFALLGLDEERDRLRSETALQPRSIGGVSHG